ncbi:MAG: 30S ribosomal protein S17 [Tenericutes bacterium GWC2_34_14]|jgi:small subunit ribosomal protein S17|nr:MAG: 30S ribosomal protein S17 [Tenericutes bacterium GWA2_35_7]OHE29055.1 MAG: 30S ribosomal protein S17 [Tenericutes bacterium GWC2_34_14]OHE34008.1 MAG: 30S ribosomal protein S17 [Tenericutes bacterium GWE2_34_108]OHE35341.1 MAG: 30S ribosomal protein S17 [Tenericutes bacterium GWF1_35_14]OHE38374.1 MAG: 30S ribosomal protein S17 [Tenericutes bacterium GWF2_35_184]OHE42709.1 MAG: 30S ribosomal protein S17 [Tenericutes bacterium RIFOXYA2_FULL_36_32]OHE43235.1 MAG: 30S ribosomal protein S
MERNNRKIYTGTVVSDKMDKTITVVVDTYKKDALYGKRVKVSKKFHVHDEEGLAGIGDTVTIMETRPLSKTKRFRLLEVVAKADLV